VLASKSSFNLRISQDEFVAELRGKLDEITEIKADVKIGIQIMHFLKATGSGCAQKVERVQKPCTIYHDSL